MAVMVRMLKEIFLMTIQGNLHCLFHILLGFGSKILEVCNYLEILDY